MVQERSRTRTASGRDKRIAKLIITEGLDIDAKDERRSNTPLHLAAEEGASEVVEMLFEKKRASMPTNLKTTTRQERRIALPCSLTTQTSKETLHFIYRPKRRSINARLMKVSELNTEQPKS
jgi:hypothetical protein